MAHVFRVVCIRVQPPISTKHLIFEILCDFTAVHTSLHASHTHSYSLWLPKNREHHSYTQGEGDIFLHTPTWSKGKVYSFREGTVDETYSQCWRRACVVQLMARSKANLEDTSSITLTPPVPT